MIEEQQSQKALWVKMELKCSSSYEAEFKVKNVGGL